MSRDCISDPGSRQMPLAIGTGCDMFEKGSGFHSSEEKQYSFMQCMHMFSRMDCPHVIEAFDLSEFDTACDLGGKGRGGRMCVCVCVCVCTA